LSAPGTDVRDDGTWHRLHPLSPVVRLGRALIPVLIVLVPAFLAGRHPNLGRSYGELGVGGVVVALGVLSWLVTRWRIEDGDLRIETGLLRRSSLRFPLSQIQAIDTVRPGLARVLGLAELRLRMAGSTGASGRLAYLTLREAEALRERLLALAQGEEETGPASPGAGAETVLVSIPTGRLIASILISRSGLLVEATLAALLVTSLIAPAAAAAVIGAGAATLLGLLATIWRRFNSGYRLTVAEAPDGLHLRSGLLETTAETIRPGRVQAMRLVEPLLWRPLGWCRFEADVAGKQRRRGENSSEGRQLRTLLPVGSRAEAQALLDRLLPGATRDRLPAPVSARVKAPLRYHYLAWGMNPLGVVTTTGRIARTTAWVPLAKVQSLRWVQGPLQRRLGLATIHLDTAGRNIHAEISDRCRAEADEALAELVQACRAARQLPASPAEPRAARA
jgi:putative membrane protein